MLSESQLSGVEAEETVLDGVILTRITVKTKEAAAALGKPPGVYYTAQMDAFPDSETLTDARLHALVSALDSLLPKTGGVLVVGLGNPAVTPDALGPKCADLVLATRHIPEETRRQLRLPELREVSVLKPGVTGQTGIEAAEIVASVCKKLSPAAVIAVDALAAASVKRVATTVQLSSAGIEPGSGVGNARSALDAGTLGVPVVALGVPTVVDALSLAGDVYPDRPAPESAADYAHMMVTPRDVDTVVDSAARLLALAVNCALQKNMAPRRLLGLM